MPEFRYQLLVVASSWPATRLMLGSKVQPPGPVTIEGDGDAAADDEETEDGGLGLQLEAETRLAPARSVVKTVEIFIVGEGRKMVKTQNSKKFIKKDGKQMVQQKAEEYTV